MVQSSLWDTIAEDIVGAMELQKIIQALMQGSKDYPGFTLTKGRLFYQDRVVIPANSSQIPLLLAEFHNSSMGGHLGFFHTYKRLSAVIF